MKRNLLITVWFTPLRTIMFGFITRSESPDEHIYSFTTAQMDSDRER
jgi:hypothetical protein